jgi:hypothetical protein
MNQQDEFEPRKIGAGYPWLKFRTDLLDEPRYCKLSDLAKVLYFEVYLLAGKGDAGGLVLASDEPASVDDIAFILRRSADTVTAGLAELQASRLVDLNGGVTVCRFTSEQGPSQADKRDQWRKWQTESRRRAKGDTDQEPGQDQDTDQNSDADADLMPKTDQNTDKIKIKSVSLTPHRVSTDTTKSQQSVSTDTKTSGGGGDFGKQVLGLWTELTGQEFKPNQSYETMIADWQTTGVTLQEVRQSIIDTMGTAKTPLYLDVIAKNLHRSKQNNPADLMLEKYRRLAQEQKRANSDGGDE